MGQVWPVHALGRLSLVVAALVAYFLAYWTYLAREFPQLDWQAVARLALEQLFPALLWLILLRQIDDCDDIAQQHGYQVILIPLPD